MSIVLILNKLDVFKREIQEYPLKIWFPDFDGKEKDYEAALSFIEAKFRATKSLYDERHIYTYHTDATNIEDCQVTLRNIEAEVIWPRYIMEQA